MYTIRVMTAINMYHMDLHFGNIMAKFIPSNVGKYKEYVFSHEKTESFAKRSSRRITT